jgi:hypothetical protein
MFARVTTVQAPPDRLEDGIHHVRERVLPTLQGQPGFKSLQLLVDRKGGKLLGIALWETEEALHAADETARQLRAGAVERGATAEPIAEVYEVAVQT